jgi:hypothetical protein
VLLLCGPVLFAAIALALGKKTGWDLFNYHWYNPFALLNGRFGFDVAVGHTASYYNPVADLPLLLLGNHLPAWAIGVFLGAMAGVAVSLIGAIAYVVLPISERYRLAAATGVALLGAFGAGAFQEIGDPANDIPAAIGTFASILVLVTNLHRLAQPRIDRRIVGILSVAGICAGVAVALKLTTAVYALGIGLAVFAISGTFRARTARAAIFSVGLGLGLLVFGGFWMLQLWEYSGNPFFPYFNDFFQSPLLADTGYLDRSFRPPDWRTGLFFPFYFTADSHYVSESGFRDAHVLALYLLIPIGLSLSARSRFRTLEPTTAFLFVFAGGAYLAWFALFDIYRYLIPLEMLSPLLIVLAFSLWPIPVRSQVIATIATFAILQLLVKIDISDRQSWSGPYVGVNVPPEMVATNSMIVMTGHEPMSYVIPYFPPSVPFLRIDGWLVQGSDASTGLAREMRTRVAAHRGPLFLLSAPLESDAAMEAMQHYGLRVDLNSPRCARVTSNISIPLSLCPVPRS